MSSSPHPQPPRHALSQESTRYSSSCASLVVVLLHAALLASPSLRAQPQPVASPTPAGKPEAGIPAAKAQDEYKQYLQLPAPTDFIQIAEFRGNKNVTPSYWTKYAAQPAADAFPRFFVDRDDVIKIHFSKDVLVNSILSLISQRPPDDLTSTPTTTERATTFYLSGRLSLSAQVGDRFVEVTPYSEVGKNRVAVGATGMPPHKFLLNMRQFQADLYSLTRGPVSAPAADPDVFLRNARVLSLMLQDFLKDLSTAEAVFLTIQASPTRIQELATSLKLSLEKSEQEIRNARNQDESFSAEGRNKAAQDARNRLDAEYKLKFSALDLERVDATRRRDQAAAVLRALPDGDSPRKAELTNQLSASSQQLQDLDAQKERLALLQGIDVQKLTIATTDLKSSFATQAADKARADALTILLDLHLLVNQDLLRSLPESSEVLKPEAFRAQVQKYWDEPSNASSNTRTLVATREIYRNLVDAQIDPSRIGAVVGDIIRLDLLLFQGDAKEPMPKPIAVFQVGEYGSRRHIVDSFLLIKKMAEPTDKPNISNFKGAAGVSLLWSDRPRPDIPSSWFARNLSWGVNVSYLDFDTSKEFEIGAGAIIGVFDDMLQIGYGLNLNFEGSWKERSYAFLGFSFARLGEKLGANTGASTKRD